MLYAACKEKYFLCPSLYIYLSLSLVFISQKISPRSHPRDITQHDSGHVGFLGCLPCGLHADDGESGAVFGDGGPATLLHPRLLPVVVDERAADVPSPCHLRPSLSDQDIFLDLG